MRSPVAYQTITGLCVYHYCDKVSHGTTGNKQGIFLAQSRGSHFFQSVGSRIFTKTVISYFGIFHDLPHL
jgi:hypothetical protein